VRLRARAAMLAARGFEGVQVGGTVVRGRPRRAPVRGQMRAALGRALSLAPASVSVKATRGEGMGFVGREEGAAALAVATVQSS